MTRGRGTTHTALSVFFWSTPTQAKQPHISPLITYQKKTNYFVFKDHFQQEHHTNPWSNSASIYPPREGHGERRSGSTMMTRSMMKFFSPSSSAIYTTLSSRLARINATRHTPPPPPKSSRAARSLTCTTASNPKSKSKSKAKHLLLLLLIVSLILLAAFLLIRATMSSSSSSSDAVAAAAAATFEKPRTVVKKLLAESQPEGDGATVRRSIGR